MRILLALSVLLVPVAVAADAPPPITALEGFRPGAWQVKPVGSSSSSSLCLGDPAPLLAGGRPAQESSFKAIADAPGSATITYRCAAGRSGRTVIRRDAGGIYTIDAQGLENSLPFAARTEWRRTGDC